MRETVERELKFVPDDDFVLPALGQELPSRTFVSAYFDSNDLRLARRGITLRHRIEDGSRVWQLKIPSGAARLELEEAGVPARPPETLSGLLVGHLRGAELVRVARLRTRRQTRQVDGAEIVDDSVSVLDGQRVTSRFRELEIELVGGDEATLARLDAVLRDAGAQPAGTPKLFRVLGFELPAQAQAVAPDAGPLAALQMALASQYEQLLAHDPGTRLGTDPEDLHQMRVATRRSRAFLRAARPLLDREWAAGLRDELGWLGSALGPARDLDVLLEQIRADLAAIGADAGDADALLDSLETEHREARAVVVDALGDPRYLRLLDALDGVEPKPGSGKAGASLADLWWDEFRRTRRRFGKLGRSPTDEDLHAARIRVKRARYAAELGAGELGDPGQRFVAAAKRLQDVLGEHQDAHVAELRIAAWAAERPDPPELVTGLLDRLRARRTAARAEWPAAWEELEKRARKTRP